VAVEALYAFGTLAAEPTGARRRELLAPIGPDLAAMVGAASLEYRYAAVRVIGRVYERQPGEGDVDETIGDAMVTALNDNNRTVRRAAMQALGAMRYERALSALVEQFQFFRRGEMAEAALSAIERIGHPSAIPILAAQLTSKSAALKTIAIEGLSRLGDRSRMAGIQAALKGESNESLVLAGSFSAIVLSGGTLDPVVEALRKPRLAAQARQYLIDIAPGRTLSFTRHALDPDVTIRSGVADVLGLAGDVAALPVLEPLRRDREPQVAQAAERAVARLVSLKSGV
jgi:HEAT repeat protein